MNMKKPIAIISSVILATIFSGVVHAETFIVNFDKIEVLDDGDGRGRGGGEITFFISLNGNNVYTEYKFSNDKEKSRWIPLNFSKEIKTSVGVSLIASATEGDERSRGWKPYGSNENCTNTITHKKNDLGSKEIICKGGLIYKLYYFVDRVD